MSDRWQAELTSLAERHDVPGAVLGVLDLGTDPDADQTRIVAHGVINTRTGVPVRPDTVFQIGSITKPYTATLLAQAIEQGRTALDQPAAEILGADVVISSDAEAARMITVGHLLTHRSGIDGDIFTDTGRGDDCIERYVDRLSDADQIFRPGTMYSYSNAGWVVAGRILERLYDRPWRHLVRDKIIEPLGLTQTSTLAEEAILHSAAVGHTGGPGEPREPVDHWALPQSIGPAGGINSTAGELLAVAAEHARGGGRLLRSDTALTMRADYGQNTPGLQIEGHQGLGWMVGRWQGHEVFGHNGLTVGQAAYLIVVPALKVAVCLLTNGPGAANLWLELRRIVLAEYGLEVPASTLEPTGTADPLDPWLGRYARAGETIDLVAANPGYRVSIETDLDLGIEPEVEDLDLHPVRGRLWARRSAGQLAWTQVCGGTFTDEQRPPGRPDGSDRYLYVGSRITLPGVTAR